MSPDRKALAASAPLIFLFLIASFSHLGGMRISDVEIDHPTPSIEGMLLPLKGMSFLSSSRVEAERRIEGLPYVESVRTELIDGRLAVRAGYRSDGIIALSEKGAYIVFSDSAEPLALRDIPSLLSIYPSVMLDAEAYDFFVRFGFDHDFFAREAGESAQPSSIRHALDVNVSDMGAVYALPAGIER